MSEETRYIAVVHEWFVDSYGFTVVDLTATNDKDARDEADAIAHRKSRSGNHAAAKVIKLERGERRGAPVARPVRRVTADTSDAVLALALFGVAMLAAHVWAF